MPAVPFSVKFATMVVPVANPAMLWFSLSVLIRLLHLSFFSSLQGAKWQLANLQSLFIKYFRLGCFVPPGLLHRRQVLPLFCSPHLVTSTVVGRRFVVKHFTALSPPDFAPGSCPAAAAAASDYCISSCRMLTTIIYERDFPRMYEES